MVSDLKGVVFPIIGDSFLTRLRWCLLPEPKPFSMFLEINGKPTE